MFASVLSNRTAAYPAGCAFFFRLQTVCGAGGCNCVPALLFTRPAAT